MCLLIKKRCPDCMVVIPNTCSSLVIDHAFVCLQVVSALAVDHTRSRVLSIPVIDSHDANSV
jgi:hypothetical protein